MPFEIDFLSVGDGSKSGDAIALRYSAENSFKLMVVDGGTQESGEKLVELVQTYYRSSHVDYVVCSHPDDDHASGLRVVLDNLSIGELWLHVPWAHSAQTLTLFQNPNWTTETLAKEIHNNYPILAELVQNALSKGVRIYEPFQGLQIGPFTVLSPSQQTYENLMPLFRDTPEPNQTRVQAWRSRLADLARRVVEAIQNLVPESWYHETLREGGTTSAENESSTVLYGILNGESVLLTSDAGLNAVSAAIDYATSRGVDLRNAIWLIQVPHHGSRNNNSPSLLDRLIGTPVSEGQSREIRAAASASKGDEPHPRKVVVNAFRRRGVRVFAS